MSEFIAVMGASGNEYTVTGHTTARVLRGEPEAVRERERARARREPSDTSPVG